MSTEIITRTTAADVGGAFSEGFVAETLDDAKASKRKELESEFNHRVKMMRLKWNRDIVQPALAEVEREWNGAAAVDTSFFEVEE